MQVNTLYKKFSYAATYYFRFFACAGVTTSARKWFLMQGFAENN